MVNTGSFAFMRKSTAATEEAVQEAVEQQLKEGIPKAIFEGYPGGQVEIERLRDVEFMTMKKYLEETDWAGVFDEKEVRPWLQVSEAEG